MVHGDCSSRGCYAMTDDQIGEIYCARARVVLRRPALVPGAGLSVPHDAGELREAPQQSEHPVLEDAQGRQRPFRDHAAGAAGRSLREALRVQCAGAAAQNFTPANNGIKLGTPWGGFREAQPQQASLKFNPAGKCPAYEIPAEVLAEVKAEAAPGRSADRVAVDAHHRGADQDRPRRRHASDFLPSSSRRKCARPTAPCATWSTRTRRRSSAATSFRRSRPSRPRKRPRPPQAPAQKGAPQQKSAPAASSNYMVAAAESQARSGSAACIARIRRHVLQPVCVDQEFGSGAWFGRRRREARRRRPPSPRRRPRRSRPRVRNRAAARNPSRPRRLRARAAAQAHRRRRAQSAASGAA